MAKIKENKIYKPSYSHIIEDYLKNQSQIVLDFDNWAWMDFRNRTIEYGSAHGSHNELATVWEYIYFIRYFYIKGITFCTFDDLRKAGCKFDMRRKRNRKYALVEIPCWMFKQLLRTKKTAQIAFETEIDK